MSADLQVENTRIAKLEVRSVHGRQGLGFYELRFIIDIDISEHKVGKERNIEIYEAELSVPNKQPNLVGSLQTHAKDNRFSSHDFSKDEYFNLTIELDASRLRAIEDQRQGKDLAFLLNIHYLASENGREWKQGVQQVELKYITEQSEWLKVLEDMGYQKTMLLEIPMPDDQSPPYLAEATQRLKQAQEHLLKGHNRDAIGCCRDAIEALDRLPDQIEQQKELEITKKYLRDKSQRYLEVRNALFSFTSAARHFDAAVAPIDWRQEDARSAITMTAALIGNFILERDGNGK